MLADLGNFLTAVAWIWLFLGGALGLLYAYGIVGRKVTTRDDVGRASIILIIVMLTEIPVIAWLLARHFGRHL